MIDLRTLSLILIFLIVMILLNLWVYNSKVFLSREECARYSGYGIYCGKNNNKRIHSLMDVIDAVVSYREITDKKKPLGEVYLYDISNNEYFWHSIYDKDILDRVDNSIKIIVPKTAYTLNDFEEEWIPESRFIYHQDYLWDLKMKEWDRREKQKKVIEDFNK